MSSLQTIPSTTDDALLDNLSPADILRYSRTCRNAFHSVQSYLKRRFKTSDVLSRFFTEEQTLALRALMSETGMFLSGSVALQFFERVIYPESDLDLYLPHLCAGRVVAWLCSVGYTVCKHERLTLQQQLEETREQDWMRDEYDGLSGRIHKGYLTAATVINLQKGTGVKIQLITSFRCPFEMILAYHSTIVMNIITHEKAYCIYPRATLKERRGIWLLDDERADPIGAEKALKKYISRGFVPLFRMPRSCYNRKSSLRRGPRFIGDSQCWVLPINPPLDLPTGNIELNSFSLMYAYSQPKPFFSYVHFRSPGPMPAILLSDAPLPTFTKNDNADINHSRRSTKPRLISEAQYIHQIVPKGAKRQTMSDYDKKKFDAKVVRHLIRHRRRVKIEESIIHSDTEPEDSDDDEETESSGESSDGNKDLNDALDQLYVN